MLLAFHLFFVHLRKHHQSRLMQVYEQLNSVHEVDRQRLEERKKFWIDANICSDQSSSNWDNTSNVFSTYPLLVDFY